MVRDFPSAAGGNRGTATAGIAAPARGFTLVELVITLILVAILAFVALPRDPGAALAPAAAAEQLAGDIRLAQSLSMSRGQPHCIFLRSDGYEIRNNNCTSAIVHPATGSAAAVTLPGVSLAPVNSSIQFDGLGRPAAAATIVLSTQGTTRSIVVAAETGRVSLP